MPFHEGQNLLFWSWVVAKPEMIFVMRNSFMMSTLMIILTMVINNFFKQECSVIIESYCHHFGPVFKKSTH